MDAPDYDRCRVALKAELSAEPFSGFLVEPNVLSGKVGAHHRHTGYSLSLSVADRKLDAPILESTDWSRKSELVVPRRQIGFSFDYFKGDFVSVFTLAEHIIALRAKPVDAMGLIHDLHPVLAKPRSSRLKTNALRCLLPQYSSLGLAVAPAQLSMKSAVMRIVWAHPKDRARPSISSYLPVGTLRFPISKQGEIGRGTFDVSTQNHLLWRLSLPVSSEDRADPWRMLSVEGRDEIHTLLRSRSEGGHPRTKLRAEKIRFIAEHQDLWDSPRDLTLLLQAKGLCSRKSNLTQLIFDTEDHVRRIKANLVAPVGAVRDRAEF